MTIWKLIYFTAYGNIIAKNYDTQEKAEAAYTAQPASWKRVIKYQDSQTITDVTPT